MKIIYVLFTFVLFTSLVYSQQGYQDVIFLNNGDIAKGIIIENVPNDYVKLEIDNGSTITFKYTDIMKFTKEKIPQNVENVSATKTNVENISTTKTNDNLSYEQNSDRMSVNFGGRIGYFSPSEEAISEIYGGGISFGIELLLLSPNKFGGAFSLDYFSKSGEPIIPAEYKSLIKKSSADVSIIPITLTGIYQVKTTSNIQPYFGLGAGLYLLKESISIEAIDGSSASNSVSENAFGFQVVAGMKIAMSPAASFLLGIKYASATIETQTGAASGSEANVGGFTIYGGIVF